MGTVKKYLFKVQYNAPVILSFAILSFIAYMLSVIFGGVDVLFFSVYRSSLLDPLTYVRLFGHVLGHVSIEHYFNNFMLVLLAGPMLEEKYGSKNMLIMILFTAVITGVINMLFFPGTRLMGASGVVFMLILLSSFVNLQKGRVPLTLILCIIIFIGREISAGMFNVDNISQITHIIGGICGAVFGFVLNRNHLVDRY